MGGVTYKLIYILKLFNFIYVKQTSLSHSNGAHNAILDGIIVNTNFVSKIN